MIHAVTAANRSLYADQIDEMHRLRYQVYVQEHKWTDLQVRNEREYDEFDNDAAVYLLCLSPDGTPESSLRLVPTTQPYLLEKLPDFLDDEPIKSPMVWDMTRWLSWPKFRRESEKVPSKSTHQLFCGLFEFAATRGVTHYTSLADTVFMKRLEGTGWSYEPLGLPQQFGDDQGSAVAVKIDAGLATLTRTRMITGMRRSVLFEAPPPCEGETLGGVLEAAMRVDEVRKAVAAGAMN